MSSDPQLIRALYQEWIRSFQGLPRSTWLLSAVTLVNRAGSMALAFLTLFAREKLGLSDAEAGMMFGIYGLGGLLGNFTGGYMSDFVGPRAVQVLSLVSAGIGFIILPSLGSATAVAICVLVTAWLSECSRPALSSLLALTCPPDQRTRAFALNRLAINLGAAVAPPVGGWLATFSYTTLFVVDGITCLCAAVYFAVLLYRGALGSDSDGEAGKKGAPRVVEGVAAHRDPVLVAVYSCVVASACLFSITFSTLPLHLSDALNMSTAEIGLLMSINPILIVLFEMILTNRLQRPNPLPVVAAGMVATGIGLALYGVGGGVLMAVVATIVLTVGEMLESPFLGGFVANRAPRGRLGSYLGLYGLSFGLGMIIGPSAGSWIYQEFGPAALFAACAVLGVASALLVMGASRSMARGTGPAVAADD